MLYNCVLFLATLPPRPDKKFFKKSTKNEVRLHTIVEFTMTMFAIITMTTFAIITMYAIITVTMLSVIID